ncbi:hypothetical protein BAUCODRAFT_36012 [Baudoinia panamericana UAMH 10762]|uniref:Uncharacterized protein n=1 Tax=Baudoinia panamericana (strain UAMH 10762) TaxID=717646 RepID=M2N6Q4_BAUPA|nr:uncharacterized protein BAUCODRAFT_36012 [Baudoinia panamericana UAMH 10762]EMC94754.1 hypothetical protein BAUCODRAFT_36012 [Baudoinia panamericana UAMH 10762]
MTVPGLLGRPSFVALVLSAVYGVLEVLSCSVYKSVPPLLSVHVGSKPVGHL